MVYQYDVLGRRTQMTAAGQQPVSYQYDAASRLTQVAEGSQVAGLGYDAVGRRTSLSYPNGVTTSYAYDAVSRLTNILHQGPTSVIESLTYQYDAAGNRISYTRNDTATLSPDTVQAAYDAANEQIQFNNATPNLTYDANGNLIRRADANGTTTYTWDARNRLIAISGTNVSASFTYDALTRRVGKTINGSTTQYLYDGNDIVAEIQNGAIRATYLRSLNIDESFVRQSSSGTEYYHTDALGAVLALTDQTGAVQTTYRYEPFGSTTVTGTSSNSFQWTGRESDATDLYFYRARYYSSILQRFITEDPIGFISGDVNLYAYVGNSPVRYVDPLGLRSGYSGLRGRFLNFGEYYFGGIALSKIEQYSRAIYLAGSKYNADPFLIKAILFEEQSHLFPPLVEDYLGGSTVGLGQVKTGTFDLSREQLLDPVTNIYAVAEIIADIQNSTSGPLSIAEIATLYNNRGASSVTDYGIRVQQFYLSFQGLQPTP